MAKKSIAEQISAFTATREAKNADMDAIMDTAAEKGETLDADQKEKYDTLESEVKEIDDHIVRLKAAEERKLMLQLEGPPPGRPSKRDRRWKDHLRGNY